MIEIKNYERDKIYRLNRRMDALKNLLKTIDNSQIVFQDPDGMRESLKKDIDKCNERMKTWWSVIQKRYNLSDVRKMKVNIYTGELCKNEEE